MKLITILLAVLCVMGFASFAHAQGFAAVLYWINEGTPPDEAPLTDACTGGTPFADGTATIQIYWDNDSNGPDGDDPQPTVGGNPGDVNYNQFTINGESWGEGPGYFVSDLAFLSVGLVPTPPRYYLRICSGNMKWQSTVFTLQAGPQEVGPAPTFPVSYTWTCIDSACGGCLPPPGASDFAGSVDRCDGVMLSWTYPHGVAGLDEFRITRDDTLIATLTDTTARTYLDASAMGAGLNYQFVAHRNCGGGQEALSPFSMATGTRLAGPPTPSSMTASENSCNLVLINWNYSTNAGLERWVITRNGVPVDSVAHNGQVPGPRTYTHSNAPGGVATYCVYGSSSLCGWGTGACDQGEALAAPAQVQNVVATDSACNTTTITWTDVTGETNYQVWRANQDGSGPANISGNLAPNTTTYSDNAGTAGIIYRYWLVATNTCGNSPVSAFDFGSRLATPAQVTGVTASDGTNCTAVALTWNNVVGEAGFRIWRAGAVIDSVVADVVAYNDVTAVPGTVYSYQVGAFNSCGSGTLSAADNGSRGTVPAQVTQVVASDSRCDSIDIVWGSVVGATLYRIRQNGTDVGTTAGTRFAHAPDPGTYSYTVAAESPCGTGPESAPESGTRINGTALPQVPNVSATDNGCTDVTITWSSIAGEDSLQIRRNGVRIGSVLQDALTFMDSTATPFTTYTYRVVAYNMCGAGDSTGTDQGTLLAIPAQVTGVSATDTRCDSMVVTWTASTGATLYTVLRDGISVGTSTGTRFAFVPGVGTSAYTVRAENTCGQAPVSAPDNGTMLAAPVAPTGVAATDNLCGQVTITWTNAGGDVDSFVVYRAGTTRVGAVPFPTATLTETIAAGTYSYTVKAKSNECGESVASNADNGQSHAGPGAPSNLAAGPVVCGQVNLNWSTATGEVTGYVIYRDAVNIDSAATNTYADDTVPNGANHSYYVRAYNLSCGQGAQSNTVTQHAQELLTAPTLPNDTLASGSTIDLALVHCPGVTSDSVFVSVNNGAYQFVSAYSPVQANIQLTVPTVPNTTSNNRYRFISTSGARRDTVVTAPFVIEGLAADDITSEIPTDFVLDQNYPNPFNPSTTVRFGVPHAAPVAIDIYDLTGRKVATLVNETMQPGYHTVTWNCSACPSGMYLLRMNTGESTLMRKMLMMK